MLYGIVTSVDKGIGIINADDVLYRFSLTDFPSAEIGMQVAFDEKNPYQTEKNWVNRIDLVGFSPVANILKWIANAEKRLQSLEGAYELPEDFFAEHCGSEDESA
jgi:hypothetical protein